MNVNEISKKLVNNAETIKTPSAFSDLGKWREEHGLTTPEAEAYVKAMQNRIMAVAVFGYLLGVIASYFSYR